MNKKLFGATVCILILLLPSIPVVANNFNPLYLNKQDRQKLENKALKQELIKAFEYAEKELLPVNGIEGVSYTDEPPYKVIIYIASEDNRSVVPSMIKGYETELRVIGKIVAARKEEGLYKRTDPFSNTLKLTEKELASIYKIIEQFKQRDIIYYVLANYALKAATTVTDEGYILNMNTLANKMQPYELKMREKQQNLEQQNLEKNPLGGYNRKGKVRPLVGGVSISLTWWIWLGITYGTLGIVSQRGYILSSTNVIGMNGFTWQVYGGVSVLQPGTADGGFFKFLYLAGRLSEAIRVRFNNDYYNYADAAIAKVDWLAADYYPEEVIGSGDSSTYHVDLSDIYRPSVGDWLRKSVRSSGCEEGQVIDTHATVSVRYGSIVSPRYAHFKDTIIVDEGWWAEEGDSGSVVDYKGEWVGLLFAATDRFDGIVCKADHIVDGLYTNWR